MTTPLKLKQKQKHQHCIPGIIKSTRFTIVDRRTPSKVKFNMSFNDKNSTSSNRSVPKGDEITGLLSNKLPRHLFNVASNGNLQAGGGGNAVGVSNSSAPSSRANTMSKQSSLPTHWTPMEPQASLTPQRTSTIDPPIKSRFMSFISQEKPTTSKTTPSTKLNKRDTMPLLSPHGRRVDCDNESIERHRRGSFDSVETSSSCWSLWSDSNSYDSISMTSNTPHNNNNTNNHNTANGLVYDSTYVDTILWGQKKSVNGEMNPLLKEGSTAQAILGRRQRYNNRKYARIILGVILLGAVISGTFIYLAMREEYKSMFVEALPPQVAQVYGTLFGNDEGGNGQGLEGEGELLGGEFTFRELPQGGTTLEILPAPLPPPLTENGG